jgi:hypothetical protein
MNAMTTLRQAGRAAAFVFVAVCLASASFGQPLPMVLLGGTAVSAPAVVATLPASTLADGVIERGRDYVSNGPVLSATEGGSGGVTAAGTTVLNYGSFDIVISPTANLSGNAAALAAFNRAAGQWEARIGDPITVTIVGDLQPLGAGVIGNSSAVSLVGGYTLVRNSMVADGADEGDDGITASLPTAAQFAATWPSGFGSSGNIQATKANFKALGFAGLDGLFGVTDATITFSSSFAFDYDNSDGVTPGTMDFETVAAHEIGHALGFVSEVDYVDFLMGQAQTDLTTDVSPLDLYRFADGTANDPTTAGEFTTFARSMVPGGGVVAITDQILAPWGTLAAAEILMSTGPTQGDGRQASHWKDSLGLGLMDPTLAYGELVPVRESDLRALDLIGYEIFDINSTIPEPATLSLLLLGGLGLARRRRRAV